jgi:hypothetical protein
MEKFSKPEVIKFDLSQGDQNKVFNSLEVDTIFDSDDELLFRMVIYGKNVPINECFWLNRKQVKDLIKSLNYSLKNER